MPAHNKKASPKAGFDIHAVTLPAQMACWKITVSAFAT